MIILKKTLWLWLGFTTILISGIYLRLLNLDAVSYSSLEVSEVFNAHRTYLGEAPLLHGNSSQAQIFSQVIQYSFTAFGDSELAARASSVFFGALLIVLMFFIGWRFTGKGNAGIIAAFVTAFHPLLIDFSRLATIHNTLFFLLTFLFYAFYEGIEGTREKHVGLSPDRFRIRKILALWNIDFFWLTITLLVAWSMIYIFPQSNGLFYGLAAYSLTLLLLQYFHAKQKAALKWKYLTMLLLLVGAMVALRQTGTSSAAPFADWSLQTLMGEHAGVSSFFLHPSNWTLAAFALIGAIFSVINMYKAGFYTLSVFVSFLLLAQQGSSGVDYFFIFPLFLLLATYGVFEFAYYIRRQLDVQLININQYRRLHITPQRLVMGLFLAIIVVFSPWVGEAKNSAQRPMLLGHLLPVEWKAVGKYLKQNQKTEEPVVTTAPETVWFYSLPGLYFRILPELNSTGQENLQSGSEHSIRSISTTDFQTIIDQYPSGWIVLQNTLQNRNLLLQIKLMTREKTEFTTRYETPGKTAQVFQWQNKQEQMSRDNGM